MFSELFHIIKEYIPLTLSVALVSGVVWVTNWFFLKRKGTFTLESKHIRQMVVLTTVIIGLLFILFNIPMDVATRGQILNLFGLVFTAVIAFSSSSIIANVMAGLMLRFVKSFNTGDFLTIEDKSGRVTEVGIMHTEIQNEFRELITFPNIYIMSKPVTVVRRSGTIISAELSLGYDISHVKVETLLKKAAIDAGLKDPFVLVKQLGDFSITYQVAGFLDDIKTLITSRSGLKQKSLDTLHEGGVEIVSPNFMNQRVFDKSDIFIPEKTRVPRAKAKKEEAPESIIFDKAEKAETINKQKNKLEEQKDIISQLKKSLKDVTGAEKEKIEKKIASAEEHLKNEVEEINQKTDSVQKED